MPDIENLASTLRDVRQQLQELISIVDAALSSAPEQPQESPEANPIALVIQYLRKNQGPHSDDAIVDALKDHPAVRGKRTPRTQVWKSIQFNVNDEEDPLICVEKDGDGWKQAQFKGLDMRTKEQRLAGEFPGNLIMLRSAFRKL